MQQTFVGAHSSHSKIKIHVPTFYMVVQKISLLGAVFIKNLKSHLVHISNT